MSIEQEVKELIAEHLGLALDQVQLQHSLSNDLGADSMDAVDLLLGLNEAFKLNMVFRELDQIETVAQLVDLVKSHLAAK
jgi:acyl carrier protein